MTLTSVSAWALASHFKVLHQNFLYVMGKALSGELSCMGTGLGLQGSNAFKNTVFTRL